MLARFHRHHRAGAVAALASVALWALAGAAQAAPEMPCRAARVIVAYGAGGGSDLTARVMTDGANRLGAQPNLQVVNITGAGGAAGIKEVKGAEPDGCTILFIHNSLMTLYLTGRLDFGYDAFIPIARVADEPQIIGAGAHVPYSDLAGLKAWGLANEGKLVGTGSFGSDTHLYLMQVGKLLGIKMKVVPYDGARERVTAMLSKNVDIGSISEANSSQYLKSGELKALAIPYPTRLDKFPDAKTAKEQGYDIEMVSAFGLLAPKGTPKPVVDYYTELFSKVVQDAGTQERLRTIGVVPNFVPGAEYTAWWKKSQDEWAVLAKELGIYRVKH